MCPPEGADGDPRAAVFLAERLFIPGAAFREEACLCEAEDRGEPVRRGIHYI